MSCRTFDIGSPEEAPTVGQDLELVPSFPSLRPSFRPSLAAAASCLPAYTLRVRPLYFQAWVRVEQTAGV